MLQLQRDLGHLLKDRAERQMMGVPTWGKVWNVVWGGSVGRKCGGRQCAAAAAGPRPSRSQRQIVGIPTWGKVWNVLVWGGSVSLQLLGDVSRLVEN